ncbi:MAG: hypothetical protein OEM38_10350, partial [Gammaproteobacteria bacterium]|nr:hypothetical protein [Gammaproteobacteria bacterium]
MEVLAQSCWEQALIDQGADILYHYPSKILCHLENKPEGIPFSDYDVVSQTRVLANDQWVCIPSGEFVFTESPRSLLRFFGPFPSELASQFTNLNIHVYFYCHGFGACVKIPEHLKNKKLIRELPLLAGCVPYTAAVCSRQYAGEKVNHDLDVIAEDMLDLVTFSSTEHNAVLSKLAEGNIQVLETSDYKIRIKNNSDLGSLRKMTGVKIADPVR